MTQEEQKGMFSLVLLFVIDLLMLPSNSGPMVRKLYSKNTPTDRGVDLFQLFCSFI